MRQAQPVGVGWKIEELHDGVWTSIAYTPFEDRMQTLVYGGEPSEWEKAGLRQVQGGSRRPVPSEGTRKAVRRGPDVWAVKRWDGVDWTTIALNVCEGRARDIADGQEPTLEEATGRPVSGCDVGPERLAEDGWVTPEQAVAMVAGDDQEQAHLERLAVRIAAVTARFAKELTARGVDEPLVAELTLDCAGRFWERDGDQLLLV